MRTVGEGTESWTGHVERFEHSTEWEQVISLGLQIPTIPGW